LLLLLAAAVGIGGCGEGSDPKPARLAVTTPADSAVVRDGSVEVRGRVHPAGAQVLVLGQRAAVTGARFHARVPLREGRNVIDVGAAGRGAGPTWTSVRVSRVVLVAVPELVGESRGDAVDRLESAGLTAEVDEEDGLLDRLLPGDWGVCETRPAAGSEVARGSRVRLSVSKTC